MNKVVACYPNLPKHVAIIMDGNARWAKNNDLSKIEGYKRGVRVANEIIYSCIDFSIKHLTLYALSLENWFRPKEEIESLLSLLEVCLADREKELFSKGINVRFIGNMEFLSSCLVNKIKNIERITCNNDVLFLNIALSYGSRQEIVEAMKSIIDNGMINVTEDVISDLLSTSNSPEVDLLIRSGGEKRLSNFLLWQLAYSELYFSDVLWPDFTKTDLQIALNEYLTRERRYGRQ